MFTRENVWWRRTDAGNILQRYYNNDDQKENKNNTRTIVTVGHDGGLQYTPTTYIIILKYRAAVCDNTHRTAFLDLLPRTPTYDRVPIPSFLTSSYLCLQINIQITLFTRFYQYNIIYYKRTARGLDIMKTNR
jgi:hypothetical protein